MTVNVMEGGCGRVEVEDLKHLARDSFEEITCDLRDRWKKFRLLVRDSRYSS